MVAWWVLLAKKNIDARHGGLVWGLVLHAYWVCRRLTRKTNILICLAIRDADRLLQGSVANGTHT